jgi:hypothetical protein
MAPTSVWFTCLVSSSIRRHDRPGIDQISVTQESTQIAIQQVTVARRDAEPAAWCWRPVGVDGADPVSQPRKDEVGPSSGNRSSLFQREMNKPELTLTPSRRTGWLCEGPDRR